MPAVAESMGRETGRVPDLAAPEPGRSCPDFIGKIFAKSSPILTWRPTKVQRITPPPAGSSGVVERLSESGAHSFSRAPTRRMVSWPLVREAHGSKRRALRALLTLIAFSLLCGSALTLCVYVLLGDTAPTAWHPKSAPARVVVAHVADERFDTLVSAPAPASPVETAQATPSPRHAAARPPLRAHVQQHGHRYQGASLHAGRSPHGGSAANHGTT